jgi:hypothetical protein
LRFQGSAVHLYDAETRGEWTLSVARSTAGRNRYVAAFAEIA